MNTLQDHAIRKAYQLSLNEYAVLTEIYFLSHNQRYNGWCIKSKDNIAETLDVSRDCVFRAIQKLISKGLIEKNANKPSLRTTDKFNSIVSARDGYAFSVVTEDEELQTIKSSKSIPSGNKTMNKKSVQTVLNSDSTPSYFKTPTVLISDANIYKNITNKYIGINTYSEAGVEEPKFKNSQEVETYGKEEINQLLFAMKKEIGITDFADSRIERFIARHLLTLGRKIGKQEFSRRFKSVITDSFKRKNCNRIRYIYNEMKSFIEPKDEGNIVFIS